MGGEAPAGRFTRKYGGKTSYARSEFARRNAKERETGMSRRKFHRGGGGTGCEFGKVSLSVEGFLVVGAVEGGGLLSLRVGGCSSLGGEKYK